MEEGVEGSGRIDSSGRAMVSSIRKPVPNTISIEGLKESLSESVRNKLLEGLVKKEDVRDK